MKECKKCSKETDIKHIQNSVIGHLTDIGELAREILALKARVASLEVASYKVEKEFSEEQVGKLKDGGY